MKKNRKASKNLRKAKKLEAQKPLSVSEIVVTKPVDIPSTKLF